MPDLFSSLRGQVDMRRRKGFRTGQFLLLGSASNVLLHQSAESLAGRVRYIEMPPLLLEEVGKDRLNDPWLRGGFPDSFQADNDQASLAWRTDFLRTYLERDIPALGPRIPATTLRRFWTMLAHAQGGLLNAAALGMGLAVSGQTIGRYPDLLVDLMLVRRLAPWHENIGKRLVKSPKVYVRDSGPLAPKSSFTEPRLARNLTLSFAFPGARLGRLRSSEPPLPKYRAAFTLLLQTSKLIGASWSMPESVKFPSGMVCAPCPLMWRWTSYAINPGPNLQCESDGFQSARILGISD